QLNLLFGKWPHRSPRQREHADRSAFSQQWYTQHGTKRIQPHKISQHVFRIGERVWNMDNLGLQRRSPSERAAINRNRMLFEIFLEHRSMTMIGGESIDLAIAPEKKSVVRLAQTCYRLNKRVEHCLQIERRAAYDLEQIGGRGLLLQ